MSSVFDDIAQRAYSNRAYEQQDEDVGKHAAREIFFRTVHRLEPRVAGELMGEPLALYRPLFDAATAGLIANQGPFRWVLLDRCPSWNFIKHVMERDPAEIHELRDRLVRWSRNWRLQDDWCLEAAVDTLKFRCLGGDDSQAGPLHYLGTRMIEIPFRDDELRFNFSHPGWSPTLHDWEAAERLMDEAFRRAKKGYRQRIDAMCRDEGLVKVRRPRSRAGDHFAWLARFQVGRESWVEIAMNTTATADAVAKAVKAKAALIGLTLAEVERTGRPPGKAA